MDRGLTVNPSYLNPLFKFAQFDPDANSSTSVQFSGLTRSFPRNCSQSYPKAISSSSLHQSPMPIRPMGILPLLEMPGAGSAYPTGQLMAGLPVKLAR